MAKGIDTRDHPGRKVGRDDLSSALGQGTTTPNEDYTTRVYPHGEDGYEPDWAEIHLSRQMRREPQGDTW